MNEAPMCEWCLEPAVDVVTIRGARASSSGFKVAVTARVCAVHAERFGGAAEEPEVHGEPRRYTPPFCRSCGAEIVWATLVSGRRAPLDRTALAGVPRARLVAFNPQRQTGRVLTVDLVDSGEAERWITAGCELHRSHYATCPDARRHRKEAGEDRSR